MRWFRRFLTWLDDDITYAPTPSPMTDEESLRLIRAAARPYRRALIVTRVPTPFSTPWGRRRFEAAWAHHAREAERLGYCAQPGCEARMDGLFCPDHAPQYTQRPASSPLPVDDTSDL